ncbi:MAG: hypothetical protein AAFZ65_19365 [Planctomycetota bacterium]
MRNEPLSRRHRRGRSGPNLFVYLALGIAVCTAIGLALRPDSPTEATPDDASTESTPKPASPPPYPAAAVASPPGGDPFASVELDALVDPSTPVGDTTVGELELWRGYSDSADWQAAVDAVEEGYPIVERYRAVRAKTDRFAEVLPWADDAREARQRFARAVIKGEAVETALREARAADYRFNRIRSLVSEWAVIERELDQAVEIVESR